MTALLAAALLAVTEMTAVAPGALEGRPAPQDVSPVQALIDAAPPGATIEVPAGAYAGDVIIERPLRLVGVGRPRLVGSRSGSVVRVRADDVTIEGFDIDGREGGDLGRDSAGVHVAGRRVTVRACTIERTLFGVYLREADGAVVTGCEVRGIPDLEAGEKGSGVHVWNTEGFRIADNRISATRDGIYIQSAHRGVITGNRASDIRYGLHYMFSNGNVFEDNTFEGAAAGTALMYSHHITFRRNRFLHNRGFASVGLLFKNCDDVVAEDNLIADNARGVFLEGSYRNVFSRNVIAASDTAVVLYASCGQVRFQGNLFVANLTPLTLIGRRTDTVFVGNYFSDNNEPDLDGDGRSDLPYRLSSVFDHFRGNLTAADLMAQGFAGDVLAAAERAFPVLWQVPVHDAAPLARPPALPRVPVARLPGRRFGVGETAATALLLLAGCCTLGAGLRRDRGSR